MCPNGCGEKAPKKDVSICGLIVLFSMCLLRVGVNMRSQYTPHAEEYRYLHIILVTDHNIVEILVIKQQFVFVQGNVCGGGGALCPAQLDDHTYTHYIVHIYTGSGFLAAERMY